MATPGEAVFDRELAEVQILAALVTGFRDFAAHAVIQAMQASSSTILHYVVEEQFKKRVIEPVIVSAARQGYEAQARAALEKFSTLADVADMLDSLRTYAQDRGLTKRATRNLMREAVELSSKALVPVPGELLTVGGKAASNLVRPNLPFVERGMSFRDQMERNARTMATGMEGWAARQQASKTGDDLRWVTMQDDKVRRTHRHAQGQTVRSDEPFYVGGYPMWFPGDPSAPEDLTINCRCVLAAVPANTRSHVQTYIPPGWLNADGYAGIDQARAPKGTIIGGQWIDTPTAILRSLNRLGPGQDVAEGALPGDVEAERTRLADEVLAREGRPGVQETADRVADIWDRTTPEQREAGEAWYGEAQGIAQGMVADPRTPLSEEQAAAVIAHLSTRTAWPVNVIAAQTLAAGGTIEEANAAIKAAADAGLIPRGGGILSANWDKALRAASSPDPIGRGNKNLGTFSEASNKTRTFASNILGDKDGVTIDTWMYRAVGQSDQVTGKVKGVPGRIRKDQTYEALAQSVRVAAKAKGVDPVTMQGATWLWTLDNYRPSRAGRPGYIEDKATGDIIPDIIGGDQALKDAGILAAIEPEFDHIDDGEVLDYFYAQAAKLGIFPASPDEGDSTVGDVQTVIEPILAAGGPDQARAPQGTPIGGEWISTPSGLMADIKAQGGASIDPLTGLQPTDGYMVAVQGFNEEIPEDEFFGEGGADRLVSWIDKNRDQLSQPGGHIGVWHDTANREVVLDVSQRVDTVDEAIKLGGDRNQQAVWDVANGVEIPTGGTGDRQASAYRMDDHDRPAVLRTPSRLGHLGRGAQARLRPGPDRRRAPEHWTERAWRAYDLIGQFAPEQARAAKGTPIGGQWIETPAGLLTRLSPLGPWGDEVTDAFGQPGAPRSYEEMAANPEGLVREVNPGRFGPYGEDFRYNCQRTVMATELRARGYDVVAPGASGNDGTLFEVQMKWIVPGGNPDGSNVPQWSEKLIGDVDSQIGGPDKVGYRYIMGGAFPGFGGMAGHVWNAEVRADGSVVHLDSQGSVLKDLNIDISKMTDVQALRVDNASPTDAMWREPDYDLDPYAPPPWVQTPDAFERDYELNYEESLAASAVPEGSQRTDGEMVYNDCVPSEDGWLYVGDLAVEDEDMASRFAEPPTPVVAATVSRETFALDEGQARAPKGTPIGGEWIETAKGLFEKLTGIGGNKGGEPGPLVESEPTLPRLAGDQSDVTPETVDKKGKPLGEAADYANRMHAQASEREPQITKDLTGSMAAGGMDPSGLEYRLKEPASLARKIRDDAVEKGGVGNAAAGMWDATRYTGVASNADLARTAQATLDDLRSKGYNTAQVKPWVPGPNNPYRGINVKLLGPQGDQIELQFHTPESLVAKFKMHDLYDQQKLLPKGGPEWTALNEESKAISASLEEPPGWENVR